MFTTVIILHVIVSLSLILVVLLQSSKGEALGSAFGGGGGGASFGTTRGSFMSKMTAALAIGFMALSIVLAVLSAENAPTVGGQPDPNARSIVTEQLQKERAASQFAPGVQQGDSLFQQQPLNLDSLIDIQPAKDSQ